MECFFNNVGTIIVFLAIAFIVLLIILRIIKNKKSGKTSCGCDCSNCALNGECHKNN